MNDNNSNGGGGGFLFGLLIGGGLVFLLGTDKGRKILKSLTEEGFGELSDIIERAEEEIVEEEPRPIRKAKEATEEVVANPVSSGARSNGHSPSVPKRRFFRRTTKS
ncbi:MAG: hypothetical protein WD992_01840 [Candidatus Levyibacteriota bacterium]